ncbi:MAG: Cj0069 family protein [Desulfosarcinaceae bacterium]|nr:Cj0069 family protein [Desulfosarcinaceae bacterium]
MKTGKEGRVAVLYPGDRAVREQATPDNNRLAAVFHALAAVNLHAEPAVYHDDFCGTVRRQLLKVDAVLVWHNPIQEGRDRTILDPMLRNVADAGIFVSAHPDVILKMGTKAVLYETRMMAWGSDTHLYPSMAAMQRALPERLMQGDARVLKQYRGNGGDGVWKVALVDRSARPRPASRIRVRHAKKGSVEEEISLEAFYRRCEPYFAGEGRIVDQAYQQRLIDGMVRCYLVQDKVVGFGHQAVNALFPAAPGAAPTEAPQPGPRHYHPPSLPAFQRLKERVETDYVPEMQRRLAIPTEHLPILWDCDFLLGPKNAAGDDSYVLCEINASSVAPFPDSAPPFIAKATLAHIHARRQNR